MFGWAEETTLDVESAHAVAAGANILLVETATAETVVVTGFPTTVNRALRDGGCPRPGDRGGRFRQQHRVVHNNR